MSIFTWEKPLHSWIYLSNLNYGCFRSRFMHLYKVLIIHWLDYASQLYKTTNEVVLGVLDSIQSTALRLATGAFRTSPTLSLCAEASIPALHYRNLKLTPLQIKKFLSFSYIKVLARINLFSHYKFFVRIYDYKLHIAIIFYVMQILVHWTWCCFRVWPD